MQVRVDERRDIGGSGHHRPDREVEIAGEHDECLCQRRDGEDRCCVQHSRDVRDEQEARRQGREQDCKDNKKSERSEAAGPQENARDGLTLKNSSSLC